MLFAYIGGVIIDKYNYFKEVNPNFNNSKFNLKDRRDPDMYSEKLIKDLSEIFAYNKQTPCGKTIKLASVEQTRDRNKRWYAKAQVFDGVDYSYSFGLTSDYMGASINWAIEAGVSKEVILKHLSVSRTLSGHILFPTWYSMKDERSWEIWPDGISINIAKGGKLGYYDRIDYTLLAIKNWYSTLRTGNKLFYVIEKNRIWFELFCDFDKYVKYFKLESLLKDDGNIVDLTSYNFTTKTYDKVIEDDLDEARIALPKDELSYGRYIEGCNHFILSRGL